MKKLLFLSLLLISVSSFSQITKDDLKAMGDTSVSATQKALQDSICNCMSKKDLSKIKNQADITKPFMECMMDGESLGLFMQLAQEKGIDMTSEEGGRKLGMQIGMQLFKSCSAIRKVIMKEAMKELDKKDN